MDQVILIAHGKLALEMKNSAEMIFGRLDKFSAIEFRKEEGLDSLKEKIKKTIHDSAEKVLIFSDLFCGTPYNASCAVCLEDSAREYEVLSGMSLPLVLEAAVMSGSEVKESASTLQKLSQEIVKSFKEQVIESEDDF